MPRSRAIFSALLCSLGFPSTLIARTSPIGPEFQVNTTSVNQQYDPSTAMAANGDFVVAWSSLQQDGDGAGVFGQRFDRSGSRVGGEFQANTFTIGYQRAQSVAVWPSGEFVIGWDSQNQDGSGRGVFAQRFDATGQRQGTEFQVNTYTAGDQTCPRIAIDRRSGNFVVVWQSDGQDGDGWGLYGRLFDAMGSPQSVEFPVNSVTTGNQRVSGQRRGLVFDSVGRFWVVWTTDAPPSVPAIYMRQFDASGTPLGAERSPGEPTSLSEQNPTIGVDAADNLVVAWESFPVNQTADILARVFDSTGTPRTPDLPIAVDPGLDQRTPALLVADSGDFMIAWNSVNTSNPTDGEVQARSFDSTGRAVGPEFRLNTFTVGMQRYPDLAADSAGDAVAVWESNGQDGSGFGIFGQRLCSDPLPPDQGNILRGVKQVQDVAWDFAGARATALRIYRDLDKRNLGTTPLIPDAVTTRYEDRGAVPSPPNDPLYFYRLKGLSPCTLTPGP